MVLTQSLRQRLTLSERLEQKLEQAKIKPEAICPQCNYKMNEDEIKNGWLNDPLNITTQCPYCDHRFNAYLNVEVSESGFEASYYYLCKIQLFYELAQLMKRAKRKILGKIFLHQIAPHLLFNIVKHFGNYERGLRAFKNNLERKRDKK